MTLDSVNIRFNVHIHRGFLETGIKLQCGNRKRGFSGLSVKVSDAVSSAPQENEANIIM